MSLSPGSAAVRTGDGSLGCVGAGEVRICLRLYHPRRLSQPNGSGPWPRYARGVITHFGGSYNGL